jgi:hypothetical protein
VLAGGRVHESSRCERTGSSTPPTLILPCCTQRTPPKTHPTRHPLLPSLSQADDIPVHPGRLVDLLVAVLLRLSASPPPYHHLLPPNTTTTTTARQPSPPHLHPLKLLPKHSYATLLALIPHRRTHGTRTALAASLLRFRPSASHSPPPPPSIVPSGIHPATRYPGSTTPIRRPRATDSLTPSSVLRRTRPRCFDVGIPASRIPPCTSGAIGKAIARLTREDLQQEKGALAYEHPVWKFA